MTITVFHYQAEYYSTVVTLMAQLQDYERSLSADRPPGAEVAAGHFAYLLEECQRSGGQVLVARQDDAAVVGFIVVLQEQEDDADLHLYPAYKCYGLITDLCVAPELRGKGIAAQLLSAAEEHCREAGLQRVLVSALADNQLAADCYRKQGYQAYEITYIKELI